MSYKKYKYSKKLDMNELVEFYYFHDKYLISLINNKILDYYFYINFKKINKNEFNKYYHKLSEICDNNEFSIFIIRITLEIYLKIF